MVKQDNRVLIKIKYRQIYNQNNWMNIIIQNQESEKYNEQSASKLPTQLERVDYVQKRIVEIGDQLRNIHEFASKKETSPQDVSIQLQQRRRSLRQELISLNEMHKKLIIQEQLDGQSIKVQKQNVRMLSDAMMLQRKVLIDQKYERFQFQRQIRKMNQLNQQIQRQFVRKNRVFCIQKEIVGLQKSFSRPATNNCPLYDYKRYNPTYAFGYRYYK